MPYYEVVEPYLQKRKIYGEMDDWADTRDKLLPLSFYPVGSVVYIKDENTTFVVKQRRKIVWRDE